MTEERSPIDVAAHVSQRHVLGALALILALGTIAMLGLATSGLAKQIHALALGMPIAIAILACALAAMRSRVDERSRKAARNDELHIANLQRALRNGFVAVIGLQPLLMATLSFVPASHPVPTMGLATVLAGGVTVLGSLLWYDR